LALVDDALPMPPDQRSRRDAVPLGSDEVSRRQRLRLKLHLLEKRGKGGYRWSVRPPAGGRCVLPGRHTSR
jgi:hypothetical protein